MKRIHLSGRLGNQLFAWAFAHSQLNSDEKAVLISEKFEIELAKLLSECRHVEIEEFNHRNSIKIRIFLKLYGRNERFSSLLSKLLKITCEPELTHIEKATDFIGFFQMYKYFAEIEDVLFGELYKSLFAIKLPNIFLKWKANEMYQCIHIRRGDYLLPENAGYGLLDLDWYLTNKRDNIPTVVVTDDKEGASHLLEYFSECLILGPDEANVFQALSIMGSSSHFIGANSTLSWWGGFLVAKRGYSVVYPYSVTSGHRDINWPGFELHPGTYETKYEI